MTILGIGGILGDAASAIVKDGQLVAAVEEVKVSRQYRAGALPEASIAACLSMAGAKPEDVDLVAIVRPLATRLETGLHLQLRALFPNARIIMLTTFEGDVEIQRALGAGARGYMLKSMPPKELLEGIRQVHAGKKRIPPELAAQIAEHISDEALTVREVEVLREIAGGNRNRDIAEKLFITEETVKVHIKHIMEKLGASDRTQAVAIGVRRGIIEL